MIRWSLKQRQHAALSLFCMNMLKVLLGNYFLFNSALYNTYIAMESVGSCIMVFICFTLLADGYTKCDIYEVLLKK